MFWWDCCTGGKCVIADDTFNRANSTDLGDDWEEKSGDWSIDSNKLKEAGTAGAVVIHTTEAAGNETYVGFNIKDITSGAKPRIVIGYEDASNYFFVEFQVSGTLSLLAVYDYTVSLYRKAGGADTLLLSASSKGQWPGEYTMSGYVYLNAEYFTACGLQNYPYTLALAHYWVCDPVRFSNTGRAGFGNGGTAAVAFDDFSWFNTYKIAPSWRTLCEFCQCICGGKCMPMALTATLRDVSGCANLEGLTFPLSYQNFERITGETWHSGDVIFCDPLATQGIELICPGTGDPEDFLLDISPLSAGWGDPITANAGSTCDPLYLEFGPISSMYHVPPAPPQYVCENDCDAEGTFMVEITE